MPPELDWRTTLKRNMNLILATSLAVAVATTAGIGCKRSGGGGSGAASDLLSELPPNAVLAAGITPGELVKMPLIKDQLDELDFDGLQEDCDIDPASDIQQIVFSAMDADNFVAASKVSFDADKLKSCVEARGGDVSEDGDVLKTVDEFGDETYFTWSGDVVLVSSSAELLATAGDDGGLAGNNEVMEYVGKANTGAAIWAAGKIPDEMKAGLGQMGGPPPEAFTTSIAISRGVKVEAGGFFADEEGAENLENMIGMVTKMGAGDEQLGSIVDKLEVDRSGNVVTVSIQLSEDDVETLSAMGGF